MDIQQDGKLGLEKSKLMVFSKEDQPISSILPLK